MHDGLLTKIVKGKSSLNYLEISFKKCMRWNFHDD